MPSPHDITVWMHRNLPNTTVDTRMHALTEEVGEVARCLAKMNDGMRGTREEWMAELHKEIGDVFITLVMLTSKLDLDFWEVVNERWETIRQKDLVKDPRQHGLPEQS